jgi:uncharacterized membrane protein
MPEITYRGRIDRSPADVFAFVADAENNPRWHAHVADTRWIDDPPTRLGRRGRQSGHLFGRDWTFVAEVSEWDPPRAVAFRVIEGYRVTTSIRVDPDGDGTLVTLTVATPPPLGRRLDPIVSRLLRRFTASRARGDFERLRAALSTDR